MKQNTGQHTGFITTEQTIHDSQGLRADSQLMHRRRLLGLGLGGSAALLLAGCGGSGSDSYVLSSSSGSSSSSSGSGTSSGNGSSSCGAIPEETAGPYPGDGSNGVNALTRSGIVRSDIRSSLISGNTAQGIPLTVILKLVNSNNACAALANYGIYLWHCDRDGNYSLYSSAIVNEDYLRGVQQTDAGGSVTFSTIFPGCYSGRWPHIHFEIYPSQSVATTSANKLRTSQLALPQDVCTEVYNNATGYSSSVRNLSQTSLVSDNVFSDGYSLQLSSVTGSLSAGYTATLVVGVAV
jgi:protocatechuate 3,4-dioxygenase beta subunit